MYGSYQCYCRRGYQLSDVDGVTCEGGGTPLGRGDGTPNPLRLTPFRAGGWWGSFLLQLRFIWIQRSHSERGLESSEHVTGGRHVGRDLDPTRQQLHVAGLGGDPGTQRGPREPPTGLTPSSASSWPGHCVLCP